MNKNSTWFAFMLIPFIIGVMIHFIIPLQFILTTNKKIQNIYNTYKIQIEQDSIRAVSAENVRVFQNSIQMYENLRANYVRLIRNPDAYQKIKTSQISLNSAHRLATINQPEFQREELGKSMWYAQNVANIDEMSSIKRDIYLELVQVQPFLLSVFANRSGIYDGLQSIKTIINYENQTFYLQYPSARQTRFSTLDYNPLNQEYNTTVFNFQKNNIEETLIVNGEVVEICEPLFQQGEIIGVSCMQINLIKFMKILQKTLYVPEFELSDNEYYLVKPQYEGIDLEEDPKIIMYFAEQNFSNLKFPANSTFNTPEYLGSVTFSEKKKFELYVYRYAIGYTYYVLPISVVDYNDRETIDMYMIVLNHFRTSQLDLENRESKMLWVTVLPSSIFLVFSIIVTVYVLKWLFDGLQKAVDNLNGYCSLMLRGDIGFKIPAPKQEEGLIELFQQFQILNQLHQYSDPRFFAVQKKDRLAKYILCYKLFKRLGYDEGNVCENIADCYANICQFKKSVEYIEISVCRTEKNLQEKEGSIYELFEKKQNDEKISSKSKKLQRILRRRLGKMVNYSYQMYISGEKSPEMLHKIMNTIKDLKIVAYPEIINMQYLTSLMIEIRLKGEHEEMPNMGEQLDSFDKLLGAYEEQYENYLQNLDQLEEILPPPDVLRAYWCSIKAQVLQSQGNFFFAFLQYVDSLRYDLYNPELHAASHENLKIMLTHNGIDGQRLEQMFYCQNYEIREDREYVFFYDLSRPFDIDSEDIRIWKKKSKQMVEYIYNQHIKADDHISVIEFCRNIKVNVSSKKKKEQQKLIKKQLFQSIKTQKQQCFCNILNCLTKAAKYFSSIENRQKYFFIFIKPKIKIDGQEILKFQKNFLDIKLIFMMKDPILLSNQQEGYFILDLDRKSLDVDRILQEKQQKQADNSLYVF